MSPLVSSLAFQSRARARRRALRHRIARNSHVFVCVCVFAMAVQRLTDTRAPSHRGASVANNRTDFHLFGPLLVIIVKIDIILYSKNRPAIFKSKGLVGFNQFLLDNKHVLGARPVSLR